ncbi:hypothetical protein MGN70_000486 [Eutypa lata]|nr:hypothetical protein MGN70_000486 [Eutypa lata]
MAPTSALCKKVIENLEPEYTFPGAYYVHQPDGQEAYAVLKMVALHSFTIKVDAMFCYRILQLAEKGMPHGRPPRQQGDTEIIYGIECTFVSEDLCP